ncbi:MAG: lyase family protein [Spirochaetales bacterium]
MPEQTPGPQLGEQTAAALSEYQLSPYRVPLGLIRAGLMVKHSCANANARLGYLTADEHAAITEAIAGLERMSDEELRSEFPIDAWQGGAGTAINMNLNEAIALRARRAGVMLSPLDHVNRHQSTNDVMPTALRVMLLSMLSELERETERLQEALQAGEQAHASVLKVARTQLRDATVVSAGQQYATWAGAVARDRWRLFKARERLKEVNLGGTAVGTGLGAPRDYVLQVIQELQQLCPHPVARADNPVEATSNYDQLLEAMETINIGASNLARIGGDLRLLASGPHGGIGEITLPAAVKGSSIMPDKTNPVLAEAVVGACERIMANHPLLTRLCSRSELELNAFLPQIAVTCWESVALLVGATRTLVRFVQSISVDVGRCEANLEASYASIVAVMPLFGYRRCERFVREARAAGVSLTRYLEHNQDMEREDIDILLSPRNLTRLGYDPELYRVLREKYLGTEASP